MYDFYANPPKTKQDIRDWLTSWLKPSEASVVINTETFVEELGFRRAFYSHSVLRSLSTHEYVWWVYAEPDMKTFPTQRFSTQEALLDFVIDDYFKLWKLDKSVYLQSQS